MAVPVINVFCMTVAYYRLKALHITSWDRDYHFQYHAVLCPHMENCNRLYLCCDCR